MVLPPALFVPSGGSPADHLPSPATPTHQPVEMLYVCAEEYDNGPFMTYPSRKGWTNKDIDDPKSSGKSLDEIASFFQNWFFWGLLTDVLRMPVQVSDFVRENKPGYSVITTKNLAELFRRWYIREQYLSKKAQRRYAVRVDHNLWRICNILSHWCLHATTPFDQWTAIYLTMLGQYIEASYKLVYWKASGLGWGVGTLKSNSKVPDWFSVNRRWSTIGMEALQQRMLADGWCRSDVQRLESSLLAHGVYYASMLRPPGYECAVQDAFGDGHTETAESTQNSMFSALRTSLKDVHQQCSQFSCCAYQVKEREYKTKHVFPNCTCTHVQACVWDLITVLVEGQVPVIRFENGVQIVPALPGNRYVAISHVWSDGLGNSIANTLPLCQLGRLSSLVNNLYSPSERPVSFWIDTLCCPVEPSDARALAIRLMRKTYEEADKVLVIDSYIQSQSIWSKQTMEILAIIYCSKWNRRLWTLQEQILARGRLFFLFNDVTPSLEDIMVLRMPKTMLKLLRNDEQDLDRSELFEQLSAGHSGIARAVWADSALLKYIDASSSKAMASLQRLLPFRATSKASDEALCLGTLLDLDMKRILSAPEAERMEKLWSVMTHIPPEVIFWIGPKLQKKGFRWAPSTFLNGRDLSYLTEMNNVCAATLTRSGLMVRYPGWMLGCKKGFQIQARFHMVDAFDTVYMVSCINGQNREYLPLEHTLNPWLLEPAHIGHATLYLLSQFDLDEDGSYGARLSHDALLILAYAVDQEIIHARCVCPATVRKLEAGAEYTQQWIDCAKMHADCIEPKMRRMGLWCSAPRNELGTDIVDLMGCSAVVQEHPWCLD